MISPNWYPSQKQLRQFALFSLFGFGFLGLGVWRTTGSTRAAVALAVIGALIMLLGLWKPDLIRIVYVVLTAVTLPIGWLISSILLRIMFYGILWPIGILFKIIGRDPLRLRRPTVSSYWQEHKQRTDPPSYYRQA